MLDENNKSFEAIAVNLNSLGYFFFLILFQFKYDI